MNARARLRPALLVAIAVIGATLGSQSSMTAASGATGPRSWLAAGDSYSSGHGIPGDAEPCRRAPGAWPQIVQRSGVAGVADGSFVFHACTGAKTDNFFNNQDEKPAQWDSKSQYDLVTFSFGGDDAGFADELKICVLGGTAGVLARGTPETSWLSGLPGCRSDSDVRKRIQTTVGNEYKDFLKKVVKAVTPGGNLVVVGYPALIEEPGRWSGAAGDYALCNGIKPSDARSIRGWAGLLNSIIGQAAHDVNMQVHDVHVTFVNVQDGAGRNKSDSHLFEPDGSNTRHNLCSNSPWMLPSNVVGFVNRSSVFHPNADGHKNEALLIADVVKGLDWSKLDAGQPSTLPGGASPSGASQPPGQPGPPAVPAASSLSLTISENPFVCNSQSRVFGRLSGAVPGERIEFFSPQATIALDAGTADSSGQQALKWYCDPGESGDIVLDARSSSGRTGSVRFSQTSPRPASPICSTFTVYAQNRWNPQGAVKRASPDHNSARVSGYPGNAAISVNGWTYGSTPFAGNPAPFNNNVWYRVADGSGWVSFPGVRATITSFAPDSSDGGPPAPMTAECKV